MTFWGRLRKVPILGWLVALLVGAFALYVLWARQREARRVVEDLQRRQQDRRKLVADLAARADDVADAEIRAANDAYNREAQELETAEAELRAMDDQQLADELNRIYGY